MDRSRRWKTSEVGPISIRNPLGNIMIDFIYIFVRKPRKNDAFRIVVK